MILKGPQNFSRENVETFV